MKTLLILVGAATLVAASGGDVIAGPRSRELDATPIYRRTVTLATGGFKTFKTTDLRQDPALSCGEPDTILVVTRPDGVEVMNDDCNSSTRGSCVMTSGIAGKWLITVFAQKPTELMAPPTSPLPAQQAATAAIQLPPETHCGTADVTVNNSLVDADAVFGGTLVEPGLSGTFAVHAPHTPNGATDTVLLAYNGAWQQVAYNNDSGVGKAAMATVTLSSSSRVVVGSFSPATAGRAALVLNDCTSSPDGDPLACKNAGKDADGDSLSNALESELGTDPSHHDTDRDGLFDYFEVIGRHGSLGEQEIRRYGANPRRRDLFVELDREMNTEGVIATLHGFDTVDLKFEDPYLDLPRMAPAPDGSRIIAVHFDIGAPCPTRPTLCGDWGGGTVVAQTFEDTQDAGYPEFSVVRRGLFQYGYVTTGGSGQAYGTTFYAQAAGAVPHEIGHNLGLQHWGSSEKPQLNRKPNYPSLMSWQFQNSIPIVSPNRGRFSEGQLPAMDGPIDEATWDDGSDARYLAEPPWSYVIENGVADLNRDGRHGGTVYADHAPTTPTTGHEAWPHLADAVDLDAEPTTTACVVDPTGTCRPSGGSAIATLPLGGGAFWIASFTPYTRTNGWTYPTVAQTFENGGTSDWWPAETGAAFDGSPTGEPAAELFEGADGIVKALLLFPHRNGIMYFRIVDMGYPNSGSWQAIPGVPSATIARHANLVRVGSQIVAVWRDFARSGTEDNVYLARFDVTSENWTTIALQPVRSWTTPGLAVGSDSYWYIAPVQGSTRRIELYRGPSAEGPWQWLGASALGWVSGSPSVALAPKVSLEFVPLRTGADEVFGDGSGQLQLHWTTHGSDVTRRDDWFLNRAQLRGYVSPDNLSFGDWFVRKDGSGDRPRPGHSVATAMRGPDLIASYSAVNWDPVGSLPAGALRAPRYLPYAFGVSPGYTGLLDSSDAPVLAAGMCRALWKIVDREDVDCRCATGQPCASGASALIAEEPLCEPE